MHGINLNPNPPSSLAFELQNLEIYAIIRFFDAIIRTILVERLLLKSTLLLLLLAIHGCT